MFAALHAVVPVNSLLGIYKALVYAKMSDCCEQVALELEFALYEGVLESHSPVMTFAKFS